MEVVALELVVCVTCTSPGREIHNLRQAEPSNKSAAIITTLCFVLTVVVTLPNCRRRRRRRASATNNNGQPPKFLLSRGFGRLKSPELKRKRETASRQWP